MPSHLHCICFAHLNSQAVSFPLKLKTRNMITAAQPQPPYRSYPGFALDRSLFVYALNPSSPHSTQSFGNKILVEITSFLDIFARSISVDLLSPRVSDFEGFPRQNCIDPFLLLIHTLFSSIKQALSFVAYCPTERTKRSISLASKPH